MRILGGLMALGYEIGTIMKRNSIIHSDDRLTIKLDTIEGMGTGFVQVLLFLLLTASAMQCSAVCADGLYDCLTWSAGQIESGASRLHLHYITWFPMQCVITRHGQQGRHAYTSGCMLAGMV